MQAFLHAVISFRRHCDFVFCFFYRFASVSCGGTFTVGATEDGKIYSWGKTSRGQLGRPCSSTKLTSEPQEVLPHDLPKDMKVVSLCASHGNTILVVSGA